MNRSTKVRVFVSCFGIAVLFGVYAYRLVQLQVWQHGHYAAIAAGHHEKRMVISAQRGMITDARGEVLATNEPMARVFADPQLIVAGTESDVAQQLAGPLEMPVEQIVAKLSDRQNAKGDAKSYVVLKPLVPAATADALRTKLTMLASTKTADGKKRTPPAYAASLRGIGFDAETRRVYPNGTMLCHVLGFTDGQGKGVQGIEATKEEYLKPRDGYRSIERDGGGKEIVLYRGLEHEAQNGATVRLTIEMGLQNIVETELAHATAKFRPKGATVLMMRPQTGEILALANYPQFDPNNLSKTQPEQMKNRAIIDMVEPGSTFKIVAASAALNESTARLSSVIYCENGSFLYAGKRLRDAGHRFGDLTVEQIVQKSSNIGAAKLALGLGDDRFFDYIKRYGFGDRTGINLPGEIGGLVNPPYRWAKIDITRIAMGQSVSVTPMQIVTAMSVIANGGKLMMPQIVREVSDEDGNVIKSLDVTEVRRVVSEDVAAQVTQALTKVVSKDGTAILASVPGYKVAGKTGTAQKTNPHGPGYLPGKYIASFLGFMPADHPAFVCLVMIDDAQTEPGGYYGGLVAAPIFSAIATKAASYLNLPLDPDVPLNPITQANVEKD